MLSEAANSIPCRCACACGALHSSPDFLVMFNIFCLKYFDTLAYTVKNLKDKMLYFLSIRLFNIQFTRYELTLKFMPV